MTYKKFLSTSMKARLFEHKCTYRDNNSGNSLRQVSTDSFAPAEDKANAKVKRMLALIMIFLIVRELFDEVICRGRGKTLFLASPVYLARSVKKAQYSTMLRLLAS
jgi:hypothetical protein